MDVFNAEDRRTMLDLLRRSDFSDAEQLFGTLVAAAHSQGRVDGSKQMADHVLTKLDEPAPAPTQQLEDDIRRSVLAKFRPRSEEGSA